MIALAYKETKDLDGIGGLFDTKGDSQVNMIKCKKIKIGVPLNDDGVGTGVSLPATSVCIMAILTIDVAETAATSKTIDIGTLGTGGDADGFDASVSVASKGIHVCDGALIGGVVGDKEIGVTATANDFETFEGTLYILYVEV